MAPDSSQAVLNGSNHTGLEVSSLGLPVGHTFIQNQQQPQEKEFIRNGCGWVWWLMGGICAQEAEAATLPQV